MAYGSKYKVKKGIKAVNTVGKDSTYLLSTSIKFNGKSVKRVNTSNPGVYKVTYSITDEAGKAVGNTVTLFMVLAAALMAVLLCLARPIVILIGTPEEAVAETVQYLVI